MERVLLDVGHVYASRDGPRRTLENNIRRVVKGVALLLRADHAEDGGEFGQVYASRQRCVVTSHDQVTSRIRVEREGVEAQVNGFQFRQVYSFTTPPCRSLSNTT